MIIVAVVDCRVEAVRGAIVVFKISSSVSFLQQIGGGGGGGGGGP